MNRFILTILLLSVTAIWGWTFTVVQDAVKCYGVVSFLALRFVIASALLTGSGPTPLNVGDLLTLGAAASYAVQISLLERFAKEHDALGLALTQVLAATAIFLVVWPMTETPVWPTAVVWRALVVTGVLATALC